MSADIAIIGMAGRFPRASNISSFWERLAAGDDCVTGSIPLASGQSADRRDGERISAGVIDGFDRFDAGLFQMSPLEADITDPQHRLLLECSWEALEDAGYGDGVPGIAGVFATSSQSDYQWSNVRANAAVLAATDDIQITLANAPDFVATRLSYKLDLRGPSFTVAAACSSSLVALHL